MASNKCDYCGTEIPSQGEFCPECGRQVNVAKSAQVQQTQNGNNQLKPDSNSGQKILLGMLLGGVLVAAAALLIYFVGKKSNDEKPQDTSGPTVEIVAKQRSDDRVYSTSSDGFVNVRESPSAQSRIVSVLHTGGEGATYLGIENNWYYVEHNGKRGYVNSRYATRSSATGEASVPASHGTTYYVVVGSYDKLDHAQKMADEVSGSVYRAVVDGTIKYRVCLNGEPSKESAKRKKDEFDATHGKNAWIWPCKGPAECVYNAR